MFRTARQPRFWLPLAGSFGLFTGAYVLDQAFRWTEPIDGMLNGVGHIFVTGLLWVPFGLLPALVLHGIFRWRGWERFYAFAIIAPAIAALAYIIVGLIVAPTTPARWLKAVTGADLPASARDIKAHFSGGGLADPYCIYFFRCSPAETSRLIEALNLKSDQCNDQSPFTNAPFASWPDPSTWKGSTRYCGGKNQGAWVYELLKDASGEQVYLLIFSF